MSRLLTRLFLTITGFALSAMLSVSMAQQQDEKATIAVMSFDDFVPDRTGAVNSKRIGLPDILAARIIEKLSNNQRFTVVERKALRRAVVEQRFGQKMPPSHLDKALDKALETMQDNTGGEVHATSGWSNYNDAIKDFKDLGTTLGARYIVLGDLEKVNRSVKQQKIPYSNNRKSIQTHRVDGRLRLRIIDTSKGTIAGAASIRTQLSEQLFQGRETNSDEFSFYDHLATLAAAKILDITFPARIVSLDPMIISRGSNDGVKAGDEYLIKREGKEIRNKDGLVLARLKSDIGSVKVSSVQKTIAIVTPVSGTGFEKDDLAEQAGTSDADKPVVATAASVPLNNKSVAATGKTPRLAVGLVKAGSTARTGMDANRHIPVFTDTMISRLNQTRRFQLIDRQEVEQLLDEQLAQALSENRNMSSAMGTLKGADYLVYGNLASFSAKEQVTKLPGSSRMFKQRVGEASGNMRIVDARSGDIIESRKILVEELLDYNISEDELVARLADAYAEQVVMMLMNALYPIKAAHISNDGQVYVNRGNDGGLFVGEELEIYKPGQAIIDPDTGVQLGVEESYIGRLLITEVDDARSKGKQIEGSAISRGDLLKRTVQNKSKRSSVAASARNTAPARTGSNLGAKAGVQSKGPATLAMGIIHKNQAAKTFPGFNQGYLERISDEVINGLANSKRFKMMEREQVDQVLDEKTFETIASGGDIKSRLQELAGADYLVHGELNNFYIKTVRKKVPYLDQEQLINTIHAEGVFRIADVHSGAIISSEKVVVNEKIKGMDDQAQVISQMVEKFSTNAVAKIVARLYPIKVLGASADGTVYINRGADSGIKAGEQFNVMRPGQMLVDPDTGQSFGQVENKIAIVKVSQVEGSRSRAKLVSGAMPESGDILRKISRPVKKKVPQINQPAW